MLYVGIAFLLVLLLKPKAQLPASSGSLSDADRQTLETVNALVRDAMGVDSSVTAWDSGGLQLANQDHYPGWYITKDGFYVNPSTGETTPPGTMPVAVVNTPSFYDLHPESRPFIDTSAAVGVEGTPMRPGEIIF